MRLCINPLDAPRSTVPCANICFIDGIHFHSVKQFFVGRTWKLPLKKMVLRKSWKTKYDIIYIHFSVCSRQTPFLSFWVTFRGVQGGKLLALPGSTAPRQILFIIVVFTPPPPPAFKPSALSFKISLKPPSSLTLSLMVYICGMWRRHMAVSEWWHYTRIYCDMFDTPHRFCTLCVWPVWGRDKKNTFYSPMPF